MLEADAKLSAGMATGVSAPGDEPKPTLPPDRRKKVTKSELFACAIFGGRLWVALGRGTPDFASRLFVITR